MLCLAVTICLVQLERQVKVGAFCMTAPDGMDWTRIHYGVLRTPYALGTNLGTIFSEPCLQVKHDETGHNIISYHSMPLPCTLTTKYTADMSAKSQPAWRKLSTPQLMDVAGVYQCVCMASTA